MVVTIFKIASAVLDSTLCSFKKLSTTLPTFSPLQHKNTNSYKQELHYFLVMKCHLFIDQLDILQLDIPPTGHPPG
jgi:hypothetical protein